MTKSEKSRLLGVFREEARFWVDVFGLKDWRLSFGFCKDDALMAVVSYSVVNKSAVLRLNDNWLDGNMGGEAERPDVPSVMWCAFHEVAELLLAEIEVVIQEDPKNENRINTERHRIIRRLENAMLPLRGRIGCGKR